MAAEVAESQRGAPKATARCTCGGAAYALFAALAVAAAQPATADDSEEDLARQLANPVASLISVPIDLDLDYDLGPQEDGERAVLLARPVVPFSLNDDWNVITRTIIPYVDLRDFAPGVDDAHGLGDIQSSVFFSPKAPTATGWIWGVGPQLLLRTATDEAVGSEKWGAGPTAVALRQQGPWTYGLLANHVWDYAGNDDRPDYDRTFVQPFFTYTSPTAMSVTLTSESTRDWETDEWSVPVNLQLAQVLRAGSQLLQVRAALRYWVDSPRDVGPEGWGLRVGVVFLFPK